MMAVENYYKVFQDSSSRFVYYHSTIANMLFTLETIVWRLNESVESMFSWFIFIIKQKNSLLITLNVNTQLLITFLITVLSLKSD